MYQQSINKVSTKYQRNINEISTKYQQSINVVSTKYQRSINKVSTKYQQNISKVSTKYDILILVLIVVCCIYNVYECVTDNLIDKLVVLMIGLIIIELGIVIKDRIHGIMVKGIASRECGVFKILEIVKRYNCNCLMIVFIIIGIIYIIFN